MTAAWLILSASVALGSVAQIFLKRGLGQPGDGNLLRRCASPWVLAWALCFVVATVLWIAALSHLAISYAYPLLGSGYVLVVLLAGLLLKEKITARRWLAVAMIAAGAMIVARSH